MNAQGAWQSCWHIGSPQAMAPHHCGYHAVNIFSWIFQERMWQSQADMAKKRSRQVNCSDEWSPHMFLILGVLRTNKSAVYLTELNPVGQTSSTQETLSHAYIRDKCGRLVFRCCSLVAEVYHIHKRPNQPVEGGGERMGTETHRWRLSRAWVKANGDRDLSPPSPSSSPSSLSNPHLHLVRV